MESLLKKLESQILVCDGAMGTMLYARGIYINRCFDELNIQQPDLVQEISREYVAAGANIIETNTFGANRFKLKHFGLEDRVIEINQKGVEIARAAAGDSVYVAGAIGPLGAPLEPYGTITMEQAAQAYDEQARSLLAVGIDLFLLETFADIHEILLAIQTLRRVATIPIIAQMTFNDEGTTLLGAIPEKVADLMVRAGADVVGANCSVGPQPLLEVVEKMTRVGANFIAVQPNAGKPRVIGDRFLYMSSPEYHAEFAKRYIQAGANIIGGCCGTTPAHIRAIANAVRALQPQFSAHSFSVPQPEENLLKPIPRAERSALAAKFGHKFVTSVEVLSPRGASPEAVLKNVQKLADFGVDAVNIPDGPRASARMSPMALALLIERMHPIETILHYCCRDRNLLGMQSDLLGAYALGLRNILIITGDPPKLGDYPDATAVFDVDSIGLTRIVNGLNHGVDIALNPVGGVTAFHIGVGADPGALDLEREIQRLEHKVEAGAEYVLTQPVFDARVLENFLNRTRHLNVPVLPGIMPLTSLRMVEFLNNEVPGVVVPDFLIDKIAQTTSAEDAVKVGIEIAQQAILTVRAMDRVVGIYLMPPFVKQKFEIAIEVLKIVK